MKIFLITFIWLLLSTAGINAQIDPFENSGKVTVYVHKQTGEVFNKYVDWYQLGQWYPKAVKYVYKSTKDTTFVYVDEDTEDYVDSLRNIAYTKLDKKITLNEVVDIHGIRYSQKDLSDKVIVFNFWATWCRPCVAELPELNRLADSQANKNILFFAPSTEETTGRLTDLQPHFKYNVIPNANELSKQFNIMALPTHVIIDKESTVRFIKIGGNVETIYEVLESEIKKYL